MIAMAIQMKATVFDLEEAELCYAPQYGSAKDPVNLAGFVAGNILRGDVRVGHWSEWKRRQAAGDAPLTLDVRPAAAVAAEAIPGTIRIPFGELRARLGELPRDREIWVHCVVGQTSYNAVRLLEQHGFKVRNLSGGITSYKMEVVTIPMTCENLFTGIPPQLCEELVTVLCRAKGLRIERIVSDGQRSPDGFWYDQNRHEWVIVLEGQCRHRIRGRAEPGGTCSAVRI